MWFWFFMMGVNLLFPVIMLLFGMLFVKKPPKKMNYLYGYRTAMSMKNEDTWIYAHQCAGRFWWKWGWIALVIAVVPMIFLIGKSMDTIGAVSAVVMCVLMIPLLTVIPHTERALREAFDKDGNPRQT